MSLETPPRGQDLAPTGGVKQGKPCFRTHALIALKGLESQVINKSFFAIAGEESLEIGAVSIIYIINAYNWCRI